MIDRELVTRKVLLIAEDLRALSLLAAKPASEYLAVPTDEVLAERYLPPARGSATGSRTSTRRSIPRACTRRCSRQCGTSRSI
jgi:hypothetical protein